MRRALAFVLLAGLLAGLTMVPKPAAAGTTAAPNPCHMGPRMLHAPPASPPIGQRAPTRAALPPLGLPAGAHSMQRIPLRCVNAVAVVNADATPAAIWTTNCMYFSASLSFSENGPAFWSDSIHLCRFEFANGLPVGIPLHYRLTFNRPGNLCRGNQPADGLRGTFTIPESALATRAPYFIPVWKVRC